MVCSHLSQLYRLETDVQDKSKPQLQPPIAGSAQLLLRLAITGPIQEFFNWATGLIQCLSIRYCLKWDGCCVLSLFWHRRSVWDRVPRAEHQSRGTKPCCWVCHGHTRTRLCKHSILFHCVTFFSIGKGKTACIWVQNWAPGITTALKYEFRSYHWLQWNALTLWKPPKILRKFQQSVLKLLVLFIIWGFVGFFFP